MAKAVCVQCGADCCTCWGCDPKQYRDGLCPKCQELNKLKDAPPNNEVLQQLQQPETTDN